MQGSLGQPADVPFDLGKPMGVPPPAASKLPSSCASLLSPEHARLQALHRQMADIQQAVAGLVSQHQKRLAKPEEAQQGGPGLDQGPEPEPAENPTPNHHGSEPPF
eukprot:g11930.t1